VRPLARPLVVLLALGSAACSSGPDEDGPPELTPRCPGVIDTGEDDAGEPGAYDRPEAFSRAMCGETTAPLDSIDACGIWHLDLDLGPFGSGPGALRIDVSEEGGEPDLDGMLLGRETADVRLTSSDLFVRWTTTDSSGTPVVHAFDACVVREDGRIAGPYVICYGEDCFGGTAVGARVEPLDQEPADGVTLVAEWNGAPEAPWPGDSSTLNVRHRGEVAYVARQYDGLRVVDLANPASPADLGHAPVMYPEVGEFYNDVKIVEAGSSVYALVGSSVRGVVVIDVTDPAAPAEVLSFPEPTVDQPERNVHTLFVEGSRLYFTLDAGIEIYDVTDPAAPERLGGYLLPDLLDLPGYVHDLYVADDIAYLNYWNRGMVVIDATSAAQPDLLGIFDDYARRTSHSNWVTEVGGRMISVHGDEDYDAHVRIIDVDPDSATAFQEIGSYQTRREVSVHNIMALGDRALVTYYQDGLRVLDLSTPTAPEEIAHFQTWPGPEPGYGATVYEGAIGVDYDSARDLVLLADTHRGLLLLTLDR